MRNVSAANLVRCGVSNWLYFENERPASALVVTEKMYISASLDNPGSLLPTSSK